MNDKETKMEKAVEFVEALMANAKKSAEDFQKLFDKLQELKSTNQTSARTLNVLP